jgi:hypothetical protein
MGRAIACGCGEKAFTLRVSVLEGVGLATCGRGHASLLLDSRDTWLHVIQSRRPRALRCRCKGPTFELSVDYELRDETSVVRAAHVRGRCVSCGAERAVLDVDIDYEPTAMLVERPLDPIDDPWQKPRWIELTGLWVPEDLDCLLRFAASLPGARVIVELHARAPEELSAADAVAALRGGECFDVFLTNVPALLPDRERDAWKTAPFVHIGTPTAIHYSTGLGQLYYASYALECIDADRVAPQPAEFLGFAQTIRAWLESRLVSDRGKNTVDNPLEYQRLKGGW